MASKNVDKRTFRKENAFEFMRAASKWRESMKPIAAPSKTLIQDSSVKICVRKRPIFEHELKQGEFDMLTCNGNFHVTVHDGRMHPDCKHAFINHITFPFHRVFDERCENKTVFDETVMPLCDLSFKGGKGVCFMFGQTGSGKTHTMSAMQDMAAEYLFKLTEGKNYQVSLSMFEIYGTQCSDLLHERNPITIRDNGKGKFQACGLSDKAVKNPQELRDAWEAGRSLRQTEATDANSVSSRSHSVSTIKLVQPGASAKGKDIIGEITLVDLAGSERKEDSMFHNAERRREGAAINASLMALKECIRLRSSNSQRMPFRDSALTQVLKDALSPSSNTATTLIATVSPCATDVEHSSCTLKHVSVIAGAEGGVTEEKAEVDMSATKGKAFSDLVPSPPARWTHEEVVNWLNTVDGGSFADAVDRCPNGLTGQMLVKMGPSQLKMLAGSAERGDVLRVKLQGAVKDAREAKSGAAKRSRDDQNRRKIQAAGGRTDKENVMSH